MSKKDLLILIGTPSEIVAKLLDKFDREPFLVTLNRHSQKENLYSDRHITYLFDGPLENMSTYINDLPDGFESVMAVFYPSMQIGRKKLTLQSDAEILGQINVGLLSCIFMFRAIFNKYDNLPGSFVVLGSEAAKFGGNQISIYATAKGGLLSFVKGVAKEIGVSKKRINIISPSIIKTKTLENLYSSDDIQRMEKTIPLGVCGEIDDLVSAIFWLLSKESKFVTGSELALTGGR